MGSYLYLLAMLSLQNHQNEDYESLNEEEKYYLDYVNKCLYDESDKVMNSCNRMMYLILRAYISTGSEHELSQEEIDSKKSKILDGLTPEEKEKVESFGYACIESIGVYSEERKKRKTIKKERK